MNPPFTFPADAGPFVWVLLALAFIAVVFAVERTMFLHRGLVLSSDFIEGVKNNLKANRPIEALTACEESPGPIPRVVKAALLRSNQSEASMRAAAIEAAMLELPVLERRLGTIATIGKIAPLIGLAAADNGGVKGSLIMPFGLALDAGVTLQIDDGPVTAPVRFKTCFPAGCVIPLDWPASTVKALRTAQKLKAGAQAENGQPTSFAISMGGFASALDRAIALVQTK